MTVEDLKNIFELNDLDNLDLKQNNNSELMNNNPEDIMDEVNQKKNKD